MLFVIAVTFGAFWVWRVIGARLVARGRRQSATGYQVIGVIVFLLGAYIGTVVGTSEIAPAGSHHPALIMAATAGIPLGCALLGASAVLGWVFLLPPLAPRPIETAPNPFEKDV